MASSSTGSPSFDTLVGQLQLCHEQEVSRLRAEIASLKAGGGESLAGDGERSARCFEEGPQKPSGATGGDFRVQWKGAALQTLERSNTQRSVSNPDGGNGTLVRSIATVEHLRKYVSNPGPVRKDWRYLILYFVTGPGEGVVSMAILVNVVVAFMQQELEGRRSGALIGAAAGDDLDVALHALEISSAAFTAFFALELVVKLSVLRGKLFRVHGRFAWFNIFDAAVVSLSLLDVFVLAAMEMSHVSVLRGFRVIRILRVLRVARTLKAFSSLRALASAVFASFFALFWSMVLLGIVMVMAALFLCQMALDVVRDPGMDDEIRQWAYLFYGTSSRAAWTVFELTFSGGWPNYARPLVEEAGWGYAVIFALYISAVTFAMFRIITALFLKDTLRVAAMDIDQTIQEKLSEKALYAQKLADFFYAADISGDGFLSVEELDEVLANEHLRAYLATLDLDASKLRDLFPDRGGEVCIEEFVHRAMSLKGAARAQDIAVLMRDVSAMMSALDEVREALRSLRAC